MKLNRFQRGEMDRRPLALKLEGETIAAYVDGVPRIGDAKLRQPLGSIMTCGGAHVVALKDSLGRFLVN